jgi:hypothetical protein
MPDRPARTARRPRIAALVVAGVALAVAATAAQPAAPTAAAAARTAILTAAPSAAPSDAASATFTAALDARQRADLTRIAADTWTFFRQDVDPGTHLPLDNLGPGTVRGSYTSAANIGVYLWAVVAARDLGLISRPDAVALASATMRGVAALQRSSGFLHQWYDTTTGAVIRNPGDPTDCGTEPPTQDNCFFVSAVDNGWYASGLVIVRQALPELAARAGALLAPMDFSIFYDARPQTDCNTNPAVPGNQPTGQMFGGYYVGQGPAGYHNGAILSDPRIAMYLGMGLHQMPGDVWWRTWRTLPPQRCTTDPDFSWQGQWPVGGTWVDQRDPVSGKHFPVWEGHYTYPGTSLTFVPTWAGGMFEALMANLVVPETAWGPQGFGLADRRTVDVQIRYATQVLRDPVWGMSPSSTADDTGGYGAFGVEGLAFGPGRGLAQCTGCGSETTVSPHASFLALPIDPQAAYANITRLRSLYPGLYSHDGGFYDAVDPVTGAVGHRRLVLDQAMILAGLDDALRSGALQRDFAGDPVSWAARAVLPAETMTLR